MEALDLFLTTTKDVSYLVLYHPLLSAVGSVVVLGCMVKFYCRLTLGMHEGDEDLTGKTALVTGASAGIGKATALDLARRNARVILACRNMQKAQSVADHITSLTGNKEVVVKCLDLCSFESVRKCARDVLDTEERLDVLINNAGITAAVEAGLTEDGNEIAMQSNHLGHFLFTLLLIDLLKQSSPSRIINVSSAAYSMAQLDMSDLNNLSKGSSGFKVYANTKLANILFTLELARRLSGTGVTVNAVHPGCVKTDILQNAKGFIVLPSKIIFMLFGKSEEEGAQTTIHLALDPTLQKITGKYFADCKEEKLKGEVATDPELAKKLFAISEKIVGISYPAI